MRWIWIGMAALVATGVMAQEEEVQSGTPAMLEAVNGKKARVFLQRIEDDKVTFQPYKSNRDYTVPADKINGFTFFPDYDADAVIQQFNAGEYAAVVSVLEPVLEPYWEYMLVKNNLRDAFLMLMDACLKEGRFRTVSKMGALLMETGDEELIQRSKTKLALSAIDQGDVQTAEEMRKEVTSEAAGLYLQARIERANKQPIDAIQTVSSIIVEHANDLEWLAPGELLCAYLYLDMMEMQGTNSVITTNSALHTARQVKNIYSGSNVAAEAEKLWISLGGAEREAAMAAKRAEEKAERAEEETRQEAEEMARREAKRAKQAEAASTNDVENAQDVSASSTNLTDTTEMESE